MASTKQKGTGTGTGTGTVPPQPSSATTGFFQEPPVVPNQFVEDAAFRRALSHFLPPATLKAISPDLTRFGALVLSPEVLAWVSDAERHPPYLRDTDVWGREGRELVTSEGWRRLQDLGIREGIVAAGYEEGGRVVQFAKYHLWAASSAFVSCPSAMTDGAARVLHLALQSPSLPPTTRTVLSAAHSRLTSRDPSRAWTSGQWMTERPGGSDVSGTQTLATYSPSPPEVTGYAADDGVPLGPWVLDGHKWFTSAADSGMTVLLAQIPEGAQAEGAPAGAGLSLFFAPTHRLHPTTGAAEKNGIRLLRLKHKLGTRALPTAELELRGLRAHLLGAPGDGVRAIRAMLTVTRVHNAATALGLWGRGLAAARAWARVRRVGRGEGRRLLRDAPLHVRTLADVSVGYRADLTLVFFVVSLLGASESESESESESGQQGADGANATSLLLLRALTPLAKALTAKHAIAALQECMEALGGVGYLENSAAEELNLARLLRDACVLGIWEGTTDVLGTDFVRVVAAGKGEGGVRRALRRWVLRNTTAEEVATPGWAAEVARLLRERYEAFETRIGSAGEMEELLPEARGLMGGVHFVVCGVLLLRDAVRDGDPVAEEVCRRWVLGRDRDAGSLGKEGGGGWREVGGWDRRIVFGRDDDAEWGEGDGVKMAKL